MKYLYYALTFLCLPLLADAQNVGIGTTQPTQTLDVNGGLRVRGATGPGTRLLQADATGTVSPAATTLPASAAVAPALTATVTGLNNPLVAASGPLAVVLNKGANPVTLSLYDVSNPASPTLRGSYAGTGLTNPVGVTMNGTTAAVISASSPYTISLFTLGSGAPALAATTDPAGATNVLGGVALVGNMLYAVTDKSASRGLLYAYDVSNPASPVQRNAATGTPIGIFTPLSMAAAGSLVCVTSPYADPSPGVQFSVLDVSNPASPAVAATVGGTRAVNYTGNPRPLAMSPGLVIVLSPEANLLAAYDLSNPAAPVLRCTYTTAANPVSVALNGTLAYVACAGANTLQVVDVSGPTATLRGTAPLDATAQSVAVTSTLVLAANKATANDLQVFNQPTRSVVLYPDGTVASAASPGAADFIRNQTATAQAGGFNVSGAGTVGSNLTVSGTTSLGAAAAPAQVYTATTGSHNMLAVAYGQIGAGGTPYSTSGNYAATRTGTGTYTLTFTNASGLAATNFDSYPVVMSLYGNTPGFVLSATNGTAGTINVTTFGASGVAADRSFNFVVFQP
jgi:hypothetical protein